VPFAGLVETRGSDDLHVVRRTFDERSSQLSKFGKSHTHLT
jgi:hypothetical protein